MNDVDASEDRAITGRRERRALLRSFESALRGNPRLSLGFGLFWTWVWLVFQTTFFGASFTLGDSLSFPGWTIPLAAYAAMFLVLGWLVKVRAVVPQGRAYRAAVPAAMTVGAFLCGTLAFSPLAVPAVNASALALGGVLMGAGTACLHVEWGRVLGDLGPRITILHGALGTVIAALLTALLTVLPPAVAWLCALVIPPASMALLVRDAPRLPTLYAYGLDARFHVPRRFLATAFVQGLSFGIMQVVLLLGGYDEPVVALAAASFALAAVALLFCALFFRMDFNQLIYQVGFLVMAFGYLLLALLGPGSLGGLFVQSVGYRFVDIMMWALCAFLIKQRGLSANWVFSITTCFLVLGQLAGAVAGNATLAALPLTAESAGSLAAVMVFVLLAGSLVMSDRRNVQTGWGMVRPGDFAELPTSFDVACDLVCRRHELTQRESEVFVLLARGVSRAGICDALTLSKETVKTHVRNIYRKMDAHAQDDVRAAVAAEQQALDAGDAADGGGAQRAGAH